VSGLFAHTVRTIVASTFAGDAVSVNSVSRLQVSHTIETVALWLPMIAAVLFAELQRALLPELPHQRRC
jgi:hypothetical protein